MASGTLNDDLAFEILLAAKPEEKAMTCAQIRHLVAAELEKSYQERQRHIEIGNSDLARRKANAKMMKGVEKCL